MTQDDETPESSTTRVSLLARLRDLNNHDAWKEFVVSYGPKILSWCRRLGLQESDAADVTQEVLTRLMKAIQTYEYDASRGRFRSWLSIVTNNAIRDFVKQKRRAGIGRGDSFSLQLLDKLEAPVAIDELTAAIEQEAEQELLREAEAWVQIRVAPATWLAYRLTALEGMKPSAVSRQIGMKTSEVYVAKSRVIKMLRQEVARLKAAELLLLERDPANPVEPNQKMDAG